MAMENGEFLEQQISAKAVNGKYLKYGSSLEMYKFKWEKNYNFVHLKVCHFFKKYRKSKKEP